MLTNLHDKLITDIINIIIWVSTWGMSLQGTRRLESEKEDAVLVVTGRTQEAPRRSRRQGAAGQRLGRSHVGSTSQQMRLNDAQCSARHSPSPVFGFRLQSTRIPTPPKHSHLHTCSSLSRVFSTRSRRNAARLAFLS